VESAFNDALATPGLWLLFIGVGFGGLVRGFSGFGTAMVYLPFAAQVLPPVWVIITVLVFDMLGPVPALPRAIREGHTRDVFRLAAGAIIGLPIGVWLLVSLSPDVFRNTVSLVTLGVLATLITGIRYRGELARWMIYGVGAISGLLGGAVGLTGPPVILIYMARALPVTVIRASIMLFLFLTDILMAAVFAINDIWHWTPFVIGLMLVPVYVATLLVGTWLFDPAKEKLYRWVAYTIIAISALNGLLAA